MSIVNFKQSRKGLPALLAATVLGAIVLTGCSSTAPSDGVDGQAVEAPTVKPEASPDEPATGIIRMETTELAIDKQTFVRAASDSVKRYLSSGAITKVTKEGETSVVSLVPYSSSDSGWTYDSGFTVKSVDPMVWKNKSYVVVSGELVEKTPASGLDAAKNTSTEKVAVLDVVTGKVVNVFDGEPIDVSSNQKPDRDYLYTELTAQTHGARLMTGLVFYNSDLQTPMKLVDPLTKETVATAPQEINGGRVDRLNNETGFLEVKPREDTVQYEATFGNYALVETSAQPRTSFDTTSSNDYSQALVDTVTGKAISQTKCEKYLDPQGFYDSGVIYSPDLRYVSFGKRIVFDAQSGDSFCVNPSDKSTRKIDIFGLDNDGNIYASSDGETLRVNLADQSKVDTLYKSEGSDKLPSPVAVTDKKGFVFNVENNKYAPILVPAK